MVPTTLAKSKYYTGFIQEKCKTITSKDLGLFFFHTCRGEIFREILSSGRLSATECEEFHEKLLYLFYGRPAYRVAGDKTTRDPGRFPVCFVIKSAAAKDIRRVFPFDSGAFLRNILEEYCGTFSTKEAAMMALSDYQLGTDLDLLAKFIALFYGGDAQYLKVTPILENEDLKGLCFELSRMLDMAKSQSAKIWDNRALTSEIQVQSSIDFDGAAIEALIIPTQLISGDTELQEFLYDSDISVLSYDVARMKPESATDLIDRIAADYHVGRGIAR
ncbi:hypothetical protein RlegWSM1455_23580 [Rhizobium laguerreae]|uniref:hypothetical protein n=1 Tax=Rhizobium laguerreae TaxID=1076926 RepID=UPI001E5A1076|nr:hypothetical protein [Rhizobium laguerreae]UFW64432.1 hypothetical protein RlegWSM1455_23580 [Rhizobium laguerreae]